MSRKLGRSATPKSIINERLDAKKAAAAPVEAAPAPKPAPAPKVAHKPTPAPKPAPKPVAEPVVVKPAPEAKDKVEKKEE